MPLSYVLYINPFYVELSENPEAAPEEEISKFTTERPVKWLSILKIS